MLLEAGAPRDCTEDDGKTALMLASERGHVDVARLLLHAGAPTDRSDDFGRRALMLAFESGHLEVACLLLEAGSPAPMLTSDSDRQEVARLLLAVHAEKDYWGRAGRTALMLGCGYGRLEVARLLLEAGAEKDDQGRGGKTALMLASEWGHVEVVRLLLEDGAEKECSDDFGLDSSDAGISLWSLGGCTFAATRWSCPRLLRRSRLDSPYACLRK